MTDQNTFTHDFANEIIKRMPDFSPSVVKFNEIVIVKPDGHRIQVLTDNAYERFKNGDAVEAIAEEFIKALFATDSERIGGAEQVVVACVRPTEWMKDLRKRGADVFFKPIVGKIGLVYCVDSEDGIRFVNNSELSRETSAKVEFHRKAVQRILSVIEPVEIHGDGLVQMLTAGGYYEASLIFTNAPSSYLGQKFCF